MFEYGNLSQAARSRVAAERFAVLAAVAEADAERKRVRVQARVGRRSRSAVAEVA
jgi:hypothetical protein